MPLWRVKLYVRRAASESLLVSSNRVTRSEKDEAIVNLVFDNGSMVWEVEMLQYESRK